MFLHQLQVSYLQNQVLPFSEDKHLILSNQKSLGRHLWRSFVDKTCLTNLHHLDSGNNNATIVHCCPGKHSKCGDELRLSLPAGLGCSVSVCTRIRMVFRVWSEWLCMLTVSVCTALQRICGSPLSVSDLHLRFPLHVYPLEKAAHSNMGRWCI